MKKKKKKKKKKNIIQKSFHYFTIYIIYNFLQKPKGIAPFSNISFGNNYIVKKDFLDVL